MSATAGDTIDPALTGLIRGVAVSVSGTIANQRIAFAPATAAFTVTAASSLVFKAPVGATAAKSYGLYRQNGTTLLATVAWAAGGQGGAQTATVTLNGGAAFSVAADEQLLLIGPATADTTLTVFSGTVKGT